ncbi:MAG: acyltransferase family protein, partial [Trebonia sp.]
MTGSIVGRPASQAETATWPQAATGAETATGPVANPSPESTRYYLRQFDLYRVVAFLGVIAQHSVLWPVPGGSAAGWSLVMVLHATRNVFFFLAALVAGYSELSRPRPLVGQWHRRIGRVLVPYLAWTVVYFLYTFARQPSGPSAAFTLLWHD